MPHRPALAFGVLLALAGMATAGDIGMTPLPHDLAARSYAAACSACHYRGGGKPDFGSRSPLSDDSPDDTVLVILFGEAAEEDEGGMPGFGRWLTDADVTRLVIWLRGTVRPGAPWTGVAATVAELRRTGHRED